MSCCGDVCCAAAAYILYCSFSDSFRIPDAWKRSDCCVWFVMTFVPRDWVIEGQRMRRRDEEQRMRRSVITAEDVRRGEEQRRRRDELLEGERERALQKRAAQERARAAEEAKRGGWYGQAERARAAGRTGGGASGQWVWRSQ